MKDIYCKIADWIVSQNIDRAVNSTDIKEIADYVFNVQIKSTGVLKVKECLREKGITVKDAKIKDAFYDPTNNLFEPVVDYIYKNWRTIYSDEWIHSENIIVQNDGSYVFKSKEPNFVYIRFSGSRKEMFLKPYAYSEFYDGLKRIKIDGWKLKTVSKKKVKPKFRPGEEYYEISSITYERNSKPVKDAKINDSKLEKIAPELLLDLNNWFNDKLYIEKKYNVKISNVTSNQGLTITGSKENLEKLSKDFGIKHQIADAKIKDEKYIVYLNGEPYYTAKSYDEATRIESQLYSASDTEDDFQSYYGSYPDVEIRKVRDSKFKDSISDLTWEEAKKYYGKDLITIESFGDNTIGIVYHDSRLADEDDDTQETTFEIDEDGHIYWDNGSRLVDCKFIDSPTWVVVKKNTKTNKVLDDKGGSFDDRREASKFASELNRDDVEPGYIWVVERAENIKDSKLTRKQKMWYGEELENLIYPQYLRRNYQKRKVRRKKK